MTLLASFPQHQEAPRPCCHMPDLCCCRCHGDWEIHAECQPLIRQWILQYLLCGCLQQLSRAIMQISAKCVGPSAAYSLGADRVFRWRVRRDPDSMTGFPLHVNCLASSKALYKLFYKGVRSKPLCFSSIGLTQANCCQNLCSSFVSTQKMKVIIT